MNASSEAEGVGQMLVGYKKVTVAWKRIGAHGKGQDERRKRRQILVEMRRPGQPQPIVRMTTSASRPHRVCCRRAGSYGVYSHLRSRYIPGLSKR